MIQTSVFGIPGTAPRYRQLSIIWRGEGDEGVALQLQLAGRGRVADAGAQQLQRHHHRQRGEQMKVCSGIDNQLIGQVVLDLALLDGRYIFVCEGSRLPRVGLV